MSQYDVAIAGAGPAGSSAAYHLAKAGARVLVLDRARFPRDKPCGGGVTARAFAAAPVDLSPVIEESVSRVRFSFRLGSTFDYEYPRTLAYMTQRHRLDAFLVEAAVAAGAAFTDGSLIREARIDDEGGSLRTDGATVEARVIIGADGATGAVARGLGLNPAPDPPVALEANFPYDGNAPPAPWSGTLALELGSMSGGYGWSFPKADHFNVGCGGFSSEGTCLRRHLAALRGHYRLADVAMENVRGHHLPTRVAGAAIVRGRGLLVGDAAGLVDPLSGEGIHAAFVSGRLAAEAALALLAGHEADLASYEAAVERELMPEIGAATLLRDAYSYSPRPCYWVLQRSSLFRRSLCQLITGEKDYATFLAQIGPLKAFVDLWAGRGRARRRRPAQRRGW